MIYLIIVLKTLRVVDLVVVKMWRKDLWVTLTLNFIFCPCEFFAESKRAQGKGLGVAETISKLRMILTYYLKTLCLCVVDLVVVVKMWHKDLWVTVTLYFKFHSFPRIKKSMSQRTGCSWDNFRLEMVPKYYIKTFYVVDLVVVVKMWHKDLFQISLISQNQKGPGVAEIISLE